VVVLERALAAGVGGIVTQDIRSAVDAPLTTVVAGLGGRPITRASLRRVLVAATLGALEPLTFLDLDSTVAGGVS
jgi:pyruvate ferredoxin oxidoreductase alpha subunit